MDPGEIALFLSEALAGRYRPTSHLASGGFCGAFVAADEQEGTNVAAKILRLSQCGQPEARLEFQDEVRLLRKLAGSDRVIELLDSGEHTVSLSHSPSGSAVSLTTDFAVLELAAGSLADLLLYGASFAWPDRLRLYRDVVKGVHQMHLKRIVHRDIKAENGLVMERSAVAKIADLGRAHDTADPPRFVVDAYLSGRGDTHFAPLEFLWLQGTQKPEDQALADLFLLGSLFFEVATGVALTALVTGNPSAVMNRVAALPEAAREREWEANIPKLREAERPALETFEASVPRSIAARSRGLVEQLTDPDPRRRLPSGRGGCRSKPDAWDLEWLLHRIDGLRHAVDPDLRKRYLISRPKHGRPGSRR